MNIIRVHRPDRYTALDHNLLRDSRLSFAARGLLTYLLSLPENWEVRVSHLMKQSPNAKRDAIYTMLRELEQAGYVRRTVLRDKKGQIVGYETLVYDTAGEPPKGYEYVAKIGDEPVTDKPYAAKPDTDNPHTKKEVLEEVSREQERPIAQKARLTSVPTDFHITPLMASWASKSAARANLETETENFLDHHRAKGSRFIDWQAAWRTWMRNAATKFAPRMTQAELNQGGRGFVH